MFWTLLLLGGFPCDCLMKILVARNMCLDLGVDQILTTTISYINKTLDHNLIIIN